MDHVIRVSHFIRVQELCHICVCNTSLSLSLFFSRSRYVSVRHLLHLLRDTGRVEARNDQGGKKTVLPFYAYETKHHATNLQE